MPNGTSRAPQTWDISENAMTGSHSTILTSDLAAKKYGQPLYIPWPSGHQPENPYASG